uniref:Uncharacterized protein n=1 Tax=Pararge aegeria TaxID=116150 RepID=S4NQ71_9NEOP
MRARRSIRDVHVERAGRGGLARGRAVMRGLQRAARTLGRRTRALGAMAHPTNSPMRKIFGETFHTSECYCNSSDGVE